MRETAALTSASAAFISASVVAVFRVSPAHFIISAAHSAPVVLIKSASTSAAGAHWPLTLTISSIRLLPPLSASDGSLPNETGEGANFASPPRNASTTAYSLGPVCRQASSFP
jgi:hypothetical protein